MADDSEKGTSPRWFGLAIAVVVILFAVNWLFGYLFLPNDAARSAFGGLFGAASSLFSGLAFAFLTYTAWLQHEELKLQRKAIAKLEEDAAERRDLAENPRWVQDGDVRPDNSQGELLVTAKVRNIGAKVTGLWVRGENCETSGPQEVDREAAFRILWRLPTGEKPDELSAVISYRNARGWKKEGMIKAVKTATDADGLPAHRLYELEIIQNRSE
ncbi:MAG: hypothetical protein R2682_10725 [Pyrinomonadaceae bacterium]